MGGDTEDWPGSWSCRPCAALGNPLTYFLWTQSSFVELGERLVACPSSFQV